MEETLFIKNRQDKHQCLSISVRFVHPLPVCYPEMSLKDLKFTICLLIRTNWYTRLPSEPCWWLRSDPPGLLIVLWCTVYRFDDLTSQAICLFMTVM